VYPDSVLHQTLKRALAETRKLQKDLASEIHVRFRNLTRTPNLSSLSLSSLSLFFSFSFLFSLFSFFLSLFLSLSPFFPFSLSRSLSFFSFFFFYSFSFSLFLSLFSLRNSIYLFVSSFLCFVRLI
jgi:hypothetical protein